MTKRETRRNRARAAVPDPAAAAAAFSAAVSRGDFAAAATALEVLVAADPGNAVLHYNRALALRLSGRPREGLAAALHARSLDPKHAKALFEIAACGLEAGEAGTSLDAGTAYLTDHAGDADAALNAARAALLLDRPGEALAFLDQVAAKERGDDHSLCRGEALRDLGRFDEAEAAWAELPSSFGVIVLSLRTKGPRGRLMLTQGRSSP
ncbi:hypothetical protein [Jiella avicenniae]|uniref:Tetratricopeptide repeat-containing protein n=1 Tax=Jiella avicenniae TaxID=2907202 RepID=A0A9X1T3R1_9HYPH|nr:hypothetical protein [Jiella avicenniae]MCE7026530.1 hypothetical protein [Jiella avicenniae]